MPVAGSLGLQNRAKTGQPAEAASAQMGGVIVKTPSGFPEGVLRGGRDLNLSKPKRQNLWHHAGLRENAVRFRGARAEGRVEALAATCMLVD
jgi:hypothetical protein